MGVHVRKILLILLLLSFNAQAAEVGGIQLDDAAHLGSSNLVLNGAGVRSKFVFDWYVAALYLSSKKSSAAAALSDVKEKRIALYVLDDINAEDLLYSFTRGIEHNNSDDQLQALKDQRREFDLVFHKMGTANKGDIIMLDYLPGIGTRVIVNDAFYTALLKIWLGDDPVQNDLKLKLLGGK
jgi:hypothetical protein